MLKRGSRPDIPNWPEGRGSEPRRYPRSSTVGNPDPGISLFIPKDGMRIPLRMRCRIDRVAHVAERLQIGRVIACQGGFDLDAIGEPLMMMPRSIDALARGHLIFQTVEEDAQHGVDDG